VALELQIGLSGNAGVNKRAILPDVVQLYDTSQQKDGEIRSGVGDYLRGTLFLYQYCVSRGMSLGVCFSGHPLAKCMLSPIVLDRDSISNRKLCVIEDSEDLLNTGGIFFSNKFPRWPLRDEEKLFVRTNCLTPLSIHESRVLDAMVRMRIQNRSYYVLHIRLGDRSSGYSEPDRREVLLHALGQLNLPKESWSQTLLVTDSPGLRGLTPFDQFLRSDLEVGHTGVSNASENAIADSMAEFSLIARSSGVFQISSYSWGSGFSGMACSLFDVPMFQSIKIDGFD